MTAAWADSEETWTAGRWSLRRRGDDLADIAVDGCVVLRSVCAVVRDRDWNTAAVAVRAVAGADTLVLHLETRDDGADLSGTVTARATGAELTVTLDLTCRKDFATNRTGLVVLVPHGVAGGALQVRHPHAPAEQTRFPLAISPHQPVLNIAGLAWAHGGCTVDVAFEGDVFEMEDQRNWSDASFKIYSRPLALPFPYLLQTGARVRQQIRVRAAPAKVCKAADPATSVDIPLVAGGAFPGILLGATTAPEPQPVTPPVGIGRVVELDLAGPHWHAALDRAAASGMPLDVRLVTAEGDPAALDRAVDALAGLDLLRVAAFGPSGPARHVSDADTVAALRRALARAGVTAPVAGGVRSHFTELNREHHRLPDDLSGIEFAVTPLFHSRQSAQLVESVAVLRLIARQAAGMTGLPVHIGPITLRPHFNDVATTPAPQPADAGLAQGYGPALLDADDPRQDAPELAAWAVAAAAALAVPGVASLAFFEESGPRGIRTSVGAPRPVATAIDALAALRGASLLHGESPDGLIWATGAGLDCGATVLVANLDAVPRAVTVRVLDRRLPVTLAAGSWQRLDIR